jgi:DNA-binding NarL/FixJ family response regulator
MKPVMDTPLRIVIADDHSLFRQGLKLLLKLEADVTVVGEAERLDELPSLFAHTACDLLLLDLGMERNSLIDIAALARQVQVIVVTSCEQPEDAAEAVRSGARAVVFKRFAVDTLMAAIHAVAKGHIWMPPEVQTQIVSGLRADAGMPLTPREREVIRHVALGLRNAEVGKRLFISEKTVKTHLNNIFEKLGIRSRAELTLYAARIGIIGVHERPS